MVSAVDFHNYTLFKTGKINNIIPEWLLSPEFEPVQLFASQMPP